MFAVTFDVSTNWVMFVLPIVAVSFFAIARGFVSIVRVGQLMCTLIVLCIVALLSFTVRQTDFGGLLPVAEAGWDNIIKTAFDRSFWFSDYIFVYFVMQNLHIKKHTFAPIFTSFAVGVVLTVAMNAIFVALFGSIAPEIKLAMSKISVFSVTETTNGRWDWLTLSVWIMSVLIKIVIFIYCAYKSGEKLFGLHFTKPNVWAILVIALLLMIPLIISAESIVQNFMTNLIIPFAIVQYLLPLSLPLLITIANKKMTVEVPNG
jgi:spore germination protein KB